MSDAVTIKIKRRASTGNAGAPSSLKSGELAFNENTGDKKLYYGYGDDGNGNATSIVAIAGEGGYTTLSTNQTITGDKTFTGAVTLTGATVSLNSSQITESENLFYTDARVRAALSGDATTGVNYNSSTGVVLLSGIPNASLTNSSVTVNGSSVSLGGSTVLDTDDIGEGSTNLYYTNARARAALSGDASTGLQYNSSTGALSLSGVPNASLANNAVTINSTEIALGSSATFTTTNIGEGTNLYYTDARARASISGDASTGFSYNNSTGVASLSGIPNASLANSTISVNGSSIALGGSVSTSFDVSDGSTPSTISDGDTLTVQGTANEISVSNSDGTLTVGLPDNVTITSGLTVGGDLTVNGSVTSVNSTTVTVDDKNIELGATDTPSDTSADGGGITLKGSTDKTIIWLNATDSWTFNQSINITGSGYGLKIGGTEVITSDRKLINVTLSGLTIDGGTF